MTDTIKRFIFGDISLEEAVKEHPATFVPLISAIIHNGDLHKEGEEHLSLYYNTRELGVKIKSRSHISYILNKMEKDGYIKIWTPPVGYRGIPSPRIPLPTPKLRRLYERVKKEGKR